MLCLFVCVCVCERERGWGERERVLVNLFSSDSFYSGKETTVEK